MDIDKMDVLFLTVAAWEVKVGDPHFAQQVADNIADANTRGFDLTHFSTGFNPHQDSRFGMYAAMVFRRRKQ